MEAVCEVYGRFHHYSVPMEDNQWARRCECGSPQRYKPSAGKPAVFTDVLVEAEDLRALIDGYETIRLSALADHYETLLDLDELCLRLEAALD